MTTLYMVITNGGDGSNGTHWVFDPAVIDRMEELADDGDESYASGGGLQCLNLIFPDDFDMAAWMEQNYLSETTLADMDDAVGADTAAFT